MSSDDAPRGYGQHPTPPAGPPVPDDRVHGDDRGASPGGQAYGDAWLRPTLERQEGGTPTPASGPAPVPPPRPAAPRSTRRSWLVAGAGAALVLAATGGVFSWGTFGGERSTATTTYPLSASGLTIRSGANDVDVRVADTTQVRVLTDATCWGGSGGPKPELDGATLALDGGCDGFLGWGGVDHVVEVPAGTAVTIESGSGDLSLTGGLGRSSVTAGSGEVAVRGVTGDLGVTTGSGDVEVRGASGAVRLETGSGDVDATGLASTTVAVKADSGDVDLELSSAADALTVTTGSGDASVRLPQGRYAVDAEPGSGDRDVEVGTGGTDRVTVRTGSGDIDVRYR